MINSEQHTARPPLWRALLLLGLLVGVLGMHALAPGGGMGGHRDGSALMTSAAFADTVCDDDCGPGHPHHADATCASGAVSGGPALPALVPDPSGSRLGTLDPRTGTATTLEGARTPPSLAELQLLRI